MQALILLVASQCCPTCDSRKMELSGRGRRGKPQRRFIDLVEEDRWVREGHAMDRVRWRKMVLYGDV